MKIASTFLGAAVLALTAAPALAAYPERPVTLLIPFSPGGGSDTVPASTSRVSRSAWARIS